MPTQQRPKKWIYSEDKTLALTVVREHIDCLIGLDNLLLREERRNRNEETNNLQQKENERFPVLDFDRVARLHREGNLIPSSVDIVMAVVQKNQNQPRIQLIELKLKVEHWDSQKINEILQKIEDSQNILRRYESLDIIRKQTLIIYSNQMRPENISTLNRLVLENRGLKICSKSSFKNEFFNS